MENEIREQKIRDLNKQLASKSQSDWMPPKTVEEAEFQGWYWMGLIGTWVPPTAGNPDSFATGIKNIYPNK